MEWYKPKSEDENAKIKIWQFSLEKENIGRELGEVGCSHFNWRFIVSCEHVGSTCLDYISPGNKDHPK